LEPAADEALMHKVRDGDVEALAALFERHHRALFNFFAQIAGARETAEDLVQDVFFRMLKYRHTYSTDGRFVAWMYQIARNAYTDHQRKRRFERPMPESPEHREIESVDPEPGVDWRLERAQDLALLKRAFERLPAEKREILALSRYQDLKYEDIAEILGCEVGAVKVRVFRAVRNLGDIFYRLSGRRAS
jgi:RNA polymerase sigma-70 factor (ECF subfamily)